MPCLTLSFQSCRRKCMQQHMKIISCNHLMRSPSLVFRGLVELDFSAQSVAVFTLMLSSLSRFSVSAEKKSLSADLLAPDWEALLMIRGEIVVLLKRVWDSESCQSDEMLQEEATREVTTPPPKYLIGIFSLASSAAAYLRRGNARLKASNPSDCVWERHLLQVFNVLHTLCFWDFNLQKTKKHKQEIQNNTNLAKMETLRSNCTWQNTKRLSITLCFRITFIHRSLTRSSPWCFQGTG